MITIQIDGKTYQFSNKDAVFTRYMNDEVRAWVKIWELEEVKENNLMEEDTLEAIKEFEEYKKSADEASILEKLRADIEKRIEENESRETDYAKWAYYAYKNIEMLLTSLDTPTISKMETTEFIPWQEELPEETKKLMCDFADWYHNWLLNRERRSPEEELDKFLISK